MKIAERKFKVLLLCHDCRAQLNATVEMTAAQVYDDWTQLVMSSGFVSGKCKQGCRSTFSDLNINTTLQIVDAGTGKKVEFKTFKLTAGRFYSEDHNDLCCCTRSDEEVYEGGGYPPVHGPCGKFIEAYSHAS
jgi:hypothetical protein